MTMKKAERAAAITHLLTENPNRDFSLGYFADRFGCAKSSISDDIKLVRTAMESSGLGYLETTSGTKGGVRYVPYVSKEESLRILEKLRARFLEPDRVLGSGFLYLSDIMFDPETVKGVARIFAKQFACLDADMIITVETKGIGIALFTAELLGLPLAVIRRESRVSEGSTVSINYFSGSADRIQQMSVSKRAIKQGARAIIIDDFMRGGGSIKGIQDMLAEFGATAAGVGVVVVSGGLENKKIKSFTPLLLMNGDEDKNISIDINRAVI